MKDDDIKEVLKMLKKNNGIFTPSILLRTIGHVHGCGSSDSYRSKQAKKISPLIYCDDCNRQAIEVSIELEAIFKNRKKIAQDLQFLVDMQPGTVWTEYHGRLALQLMNNLKPTFFSDL